MKKTLFALSLLVYSVHLFAQTLDPTRATDWTFAGIKVSSTLNFEIIQLSDFGIVGDNTTPNDVTIGITNPYTLLPTSTAPQLK